MERNNVWYFKKWRNIKEVHSVSLMTNKTKSQLSTSQLNINDRKILKGSQRKKKTNHKTMTIRLFINYNKCQETMKYYPQSTEWK